MVDHTVRRLAKKVFPYIWLRHKLTSSSSSTGIFPFSEMTVFSQEVGNAVIVYLHMYRPTLSNYLEKHVPSMAFTKMQFWTHVAFLCLQVRLATDNVFDYFLTTCSLTAEVALHCYINGYEDVLPLASVFLIAFFETELYTGFHKAGGWLELHHYTKETSCPELYEFVNPHIKEINSPSEHLPILISIKNEHLAAERREKLLSLRSHKIGEISRDEQTKALVAKIFNWDFLENQRISEVKPGILKRKVNVRRKKKKSNNDEKSDDSADEVPDADDKTYNVGEFLCLNDEAQPSESTTTLFESRSNNDEKSPDDLKSTERSNNQLCSSNEISGKVKIGSSNLRALCNFYENLSAQSNATVSNSQRLKNDNRRRLGMKSSTVKNEMGNNWIKDNYVERYPKSVSCTGETAITFPESENFTPETAINSTESFRADAQSEFTKSFQELGFRCLCVGNSNTDENSEEFTNYAEIMEKCRYFQNKYTSIKFAILIPNDYFKDKSLHVSETENFNGSFFDKMHNEQRSRATEQIFKNCVSPLPQLEIEEPIFAVQKFGKTQCNLVFGPKLQSATESIQKSRFPVTKIEENNLASRSEPLKTGRFSVMKVDENQIISGNEMSLSENVRTIEPTTVSRFRVSKVYENPLKNETIASEKNLSSKTRRISRFTVTKVRENQLQGEPNKLEENLTNESTKIARFTVTKVNENQSYNETSILGKNLTNETTKISRFTVTKVNENLSKTKMSLGKKWTNETTKIGRFTVTKIKENNPTSILKNRLGNGTSKTSRSTLGKGNKNNLNPTSILRRKWEKDRPKKLRFPVPRMEDSELTPKTGQRLKRKSYPTNATKISRFSVTKIEDQTRLSEKNDSTSSESSDDSENESVHFQDNGSVKYQKRVSFADEPLISYFRPYSSDESWNSVTSQHIFNQNSSENSLSTVRESKDSACQVDISKTPTVSNLEEESRGLLRRHSFGDGESSSDQTGRIAAIGRSLLDRILRRSSSRESTESTTEDSKIEELTKSLEATGVENPVVFKI